MIRGRHYCSRLHEAGHYRKSRTSRTRPTRTWSGFGRTWSPYFELGQLREEYTGSYFCKIDYQWSATVLNRVNLVVVGNKPLSQTTHLKNETYSDRVLFYVGGCGRPYLELWQLREEDTGSYICRIDYKWSATVLNRVNLVVVGEYLVKFSSISLVVVVVLSMDRLRY
ncbi:hypothetical protein JTE90_013021 [Oedothorax gibbosus]|uniref:Ig-like domain-containing protein n=1 Tax=Oedothorax gibbosus TaxID=931172 RepID=A0AAV6UAE1_9ARAC|nr:hypothetical protein JTE90_013021 [Oedothorax gibbosus]